MGNFQLVFLQYAGKTPSLAGCAKCHLKFFTPQQLMRQPQAAAEYLREKFDQHTCTREIVEDKRPGTPQTRRLRIVKRTDDTSALGICQVCNMRFLAPSHLHGYAHLAEKDIRRQFERHMCTRRDAS
jgi:hypothetical protein